MILRSGVSFPWRPWGPALVSARSRASAHSKVGMLLGCVLAAFLWTDFAEAFCLTTTCKPDVSCDESPSTCCEYDADGCDIRGIQLAWPTSCVSYSVHNGGSERRGISADTLENYVDSALERWLQSDCGGAPPNITLKNLGPISCDLAQYSSTEGNANLWVFQDDSWSHESAGVSDQYYSSALAYTTLSYDPTTGQLYDADVELNSFEAAFTTSATNVDIDLESVIVHEAGHFLGLDHSNVSGATMSRNYDAGSTWMRSLSSDDVLGLCAAYPENRSVSKNDSCEPRHGFSKTCSGSPGGCAFRPNSVPSESNWGLALGFAGLFFVQRRRARRT